MKEGMKSFPNFHLHKRYENIDFSRLIITDRYDILNNQRFGGDPHRGSYLSGLHLERTVHIIDRNPPIYSPHYERFFSLFRDILGLDSVSYFPTYPDRIRHPSDITNKHLISRIEDISLYFALIFSPPEVVFMLGDDVSSLMFDRPPAFGDVFRYGENNVPFVPLPHPSHTFRSSREEAALKVVFSYVRDEIIPKN